MKKSLVIALIMVLAMAGIASAEVNFGGELKVEYVVDTDKEAAGTGKASAPLLLKAVAEEEGVWKADAELKVSATNSDDRMKVGKWSMNLTDELFVADLWGGGLEKTEVKTPLEFIKAGKKANDDSAKLRVTSDVAGYVDLTLDYDPNTLFVFAKKPLDDVTVGGAIKKDLADEGVVGVGHVVYTAGALTLTGEAGVDTVVADKDNTMLGGKVAYKLSDQLTVNGKVTHKAKNLVKVDEEPVGELVIEPGVTYTENLFKANATYTRKDDLDKDETKATNKIKANVTYRSNEDVAFDDLFDDYDTLTGYAAFAEAAYTTAKDVEGDKEPLIEATLKGAGVAVPDMVWAYGEFAYKSDKDENVKDEDFQFIIGNNKLTEDAVLFVKDYYKVTAEGTVQLTDKVKIVPAVKFGKWTALSGTKSEDYVAAVPDKVEWKTDADGKPTPEAEVVEGSPAKNFNDLKADDMNELELSAALTYKLSDSSEVGISYTDRTQKFTEPEGVTMDDELKDGFAKVWFQTKF